MKRLATVVMLLVLAVPTFGQQAPNTEVRDLVSGKLFPLTMQLKDLSPDWMRVTIGGQTEANNPTQMYTMMFGGGAAAPGGAAYYTKGVTVVLGGETFMVAYKVQTKPIDWAKMMSEGPQPPTPEELTLESPLALSLLNLRAVTSLDNIRPVNVEQEIADAKAAAEAAKEEAEEWVEQPEGKGKDVSVDRLKQVALAAIMYAQDYDEKLPPMKSAEAAKEALKPYVRSEEIFVDPTSKKPFKANAALSGKQLSQIEQPGETILFYEAQPGADGTRAAAFVDGHVARLSAEDWERLKKLSKIP